MNKKKILKIFILFSVLFINTSFVYADGTSLCKSQSVAKIIQLINLFINIIRIAVPIILIFVISIKLASAIMNDKGIDSVKKGIVYNIVAAVLIFMIPSFVNIITRLTGTYESYQDCLKLSKNPVNDGGNGNNSNDKSGPVITSITFNGAFVTVNAKNDGGGVITGYFFSNTNTKPSLNDEHWVLKKTNRLEIAKMPGTYYVFVKNSSNKISASKKLTITFEDLYNTGAISRKYQAYTSTESELTHTLSEEELAEYNEFIANSVKSAGLFTSEGVATAGAAAIWYLYAKYNTQIPYNSNVSCASTRYNEYFGINPRIGSFIASPGSSRAKECKGTNNGLDCQSFVGWSIHNGGFKAENTAGSYKGDYVTYCKGSYCSNKAAAIEMYQSLEVGDIIYCNAHKMLVAGHFDGGLYVFESASPVGISKFTYDQLYKNGDAGAYTSAMKMAKYYSNPQNYACLQDSKGNIVPIPSAWESYSSLFRDNCKA